VSAWLWVPVGASAFAMVMSPLIAVAKKTPPGSAAIAVTLNLGIIFCILKGGGVL
jgi:hypothetical protein